jgi:hypothetical protein
MNIKYFKTIFFIMKLSYIYTNPINNSENADIINMIKEKRKKAIEKYKNRKNNPKTLTTSQLKEKEKKIKRLKKIQLGCGAFVGCNFLINVFNNSSDFEEDKMNIILYPSKNKELKEIINNLKNTDISINQKNIKRYLNLDSNDILYCNNDVDTKFKNIIQQEILNVFLKKLHKKILSFEKKSIPKKDINQQDIKWDQYFKQKQIYYQENNEQINTITFIDLLKINDNNKIFMYIANYINNIEDSFSKKVTKILLDTLQNNNAKNPIILHKISDINNYKLYKTIWRGIKNMFFWKNIFLPCIFR